MAKDKDKKIVAVYIGRGDSMMDVPAKDLTAEDVEGIDYTLDEILDLPVHSENKLYEKPGKSNKPRTEDSEVDNG